MIVSTAKAAEAADVLCVGLEDLTRDGLTKAFRAKAKECHPDYHGDTQLQLWARVSWAKEVLGYWLEKHPNTIVEAKGAASADACLACNGTGRLAVVSRGFGKSLTMQCHMCKGLGVLIPEENDHD